jgi:superfamily II DNA/RNA helicase
MDIPDITLVIQWRATCKISMLWQRWGRAARDQQLKGTTVLFAEKEYFDDVRQERHERQDVRKRKADDKSSAQAAGTTQHRNKCCHVAEQVAAPTEQDENEGIDGNEHGSGCSSSGNNADNGDSELHDMLKPTMEEKTRVQKKNRELDPAMDFLINAHLRDTVLCRCRVFCVHFDNTSAGEND